MKPDKLHESKIPEELVSCQYIEECVYFHTPEASAVSQNVSVCKDQPNKDNLIELIK